jgi:hypothetical protein
MLHSRRYGTAVHGMKKIVAVAFVLLLMAGCEKQKPDHSYVFTGFTTTKDGIREYVFESDDVTYSAICIGHQKGEQVDGDCRAIQPFLNHMIPPTYRTSGDSEHVYLDIPSLNLQFEVDEGY